ncbi:hypothetical protein ACFY0F_23415 [Streptomyces sp. NPDC001544]|uniref:hypothetical protein n=1 Tax=Streptomyces sp. NPDC001544 TaxID=3364584 RepID=UPI0036A03D58
MPRQVDQLPPDATSLARRIRALERQVDELRAARRMVSATVGTLRVYADDGTTLLAVLGPEDGAGGGGLWTRGLQDPLNMSAYLNSGELGFRPVEDGAVDVPAGITYDSDAFQYTDLILTSGAVRTAHHRAVVILESNFAGGNPYVYVQGESGTQCNMDVLGVLTASSIAYGSASITPSAANTPTSVAVTGLSVAGGTFNAVVSPQTSVPGTQVTGVGFSNLTSTGLTIWLTRSNTTTTIVNWLVIGV